jgi:signal transduction histidine kinase
MLKNLRLKFILFNMIIVTGMLCVIFGLVFHFTKSSLESESLNMMQTIASVPFQLDRPGERPKEIRLPYFTLQISAKGDLIAVGGGYYDLSDQAFLKELTDAVFAAKTQTGILQEYHLRFYRAPAPGGETLVFADVSSEYTTLHHLIRTCCVIGIISFLIFLGISFLLAKWAVKPVEKAWQQQRQFVADASHELKTPLTVIMTNAELLQSPAYDTENKAQFSDSILTMAKQMRSLVERLLTLARADSGRAELVFSKLNYSKLVYDALLPFEPVFFEKGLLLSSQISPDIFVSGSAAHLRQAVEVLLDNAQKYSAPNGETFVSLQKHTRGHCLLAVSNPGEAISSEELHQIFRRFYRADKAKSRTGSFGLGLSIAEQIVQEHHGRIWAESKLGINSFFVELPTVYKV